MIKIKSKSELEKMQRASIIAANALHLGGRSLKPGMTTFELSRIIHDYIVRRGAKPSFLGYEGFRGSACISVNDVVIHGIPSTKTKLKEGDIVSIDVGAYIDGFHGDTAYTFPVGKISEEAARLIKAAEDCLYAAISKTLAGNRVGDISYAIENHCAKNGYYVVKEYIGHGVGRELHEDPEVPNYGKPGMGPRLANGMTLAIEPMVNIKGSEVVTLKDGFTVVTKSGSLSAHFEHTVVISPNGPVILTKPTI
ncbi:MAG: type I methionyl aminopeptidase [Oscillospiraceae bacterium]|nr:type I methionyl aminopeptidase [Oscillospiraceae bacterium]